MHNFVMDEVQFQLLSFESEKKTSPKGFSASKCDVGNWIFSKSWEFLGGIFGRNFLKNFFWKKFFGSIFGRNFFGKLFLEKNYWEDFWED